MKRIGIFFIVFTLALSVSAFQSQQYLDYIAQWRDVAIQHQMTFGIPASITLAQGLLESRAGTSELAKNANNHFGIKCTSDWMGDVYRYDDDRKDECFRVYLNAEESYKDHALFLKRTRYARLFEIPVSDYASWARGLKECGYATDPAYAQKLIKVIEEYQLAEVGKDVKADDVVAEPQYGYTQASGDTFAGPAIYVAPLTARQEREQFFIRHGTQRNNGVRYIIANAGDTYASIAFSLNLKERKLRENNDALGRTLKRGERVYLSAKKSQAPKAKAYVWVRPGESIWDICQREAITEKSFREMNGLPIDIQVFQTRQQVLLRKEKK